MLSIRTSAILALLAFLWGSLAPQTAAARPWITCASKYTKVEIGRPGKAAIQVEVHAKRGKRIAVVLPAELGTRYAAGRMCVGSACIPVTFLIFSALSGPMGDLFSGVAIGAEVIPWGNVFTLTPGADGAYFLEIEGSANMTCPAH